LGLRECSFLGHVGKLNWGDEMRSADIFLFPSETGGHPQVLLQAAGCGLPCVAMNSYHPDAVVDGETGFLAGSSEELAQKIRCARPGCGAACDHVEGSGAARPTFRTGTRSPRSGRKPSRRSWEKTRDAFQKRLPAGTARYTCWTITPFYPKVENESGGCFVSEPLVELSKVGMQSTVFAVEPFYRPKSIRVRRRQMRSGAGNPALPGGLGLASSGLGLFMGCARGLKIAYPVSN